MFQILLDRAKKGARAHTSMASFIGDRQLGLLGILVI